MALRPLEIWVRDEAGNTASCPSLAIITDANGSCDPSMHAEALFAENEVRIPGVRIDINIQRCPDDTIKIVGMTYPFSPSYAAWTQIGAFIPSECAATVAATKNTHPLNGITMHDLFLISQHILGITPLTNPYQLIAADANQDGQITDDDRLFLRRLMKGVITQFPNGRSWRFVPADFVFDPLHPFVFPEKVQVARTENPPQAFFFRGVKIGDVDFSADPTQ